MSDKYCRHIPCQTALRKELVSQGRADEATNVLRYDAYAPCIQPEPEKLEGVWYYFPKTDSPGYTQLLLHESETEWIHCMESDCPEREVQKVTVTIERVIE